MIRAPFLIIILLLPSSLLGACSGSGTTWSCTAGSTPANVNTALSSASDGATLTFANGSYTWGGTVITWSGTKSATLICATVGGCTVSASSRVIDIPTGSSTKLYRISGFVFNLGGNTFMWTCPGGGCSNVVTQLRIDHNTFNYTASGDIITIGENTATQYVYGVIDHNSANCTVSCYFAEWIGVTNSFDPTPPSPPLGTINNMFFEDNTVSITTLNNNGTGCVDHWGGSAVVWRHNTSTNCRVISHGVLHGGGPSNFEIYNNSITMDANSGSSEQSCYRCIHHQGSNTMVVFNNTLTPFSGKSSTPIEFLHYRDWTAGSLCDGTNGGGYPDGNRAPTGTWFGYPCFRQPGRDVTGAYKPMYSWNNQWSDGTIANLDYGDPGGSPDYSSTHIVQNREYYLSVSANAQTSSTSPFNGTTGMGFGTLARRPATCTTSTESGAGVGYFATDQGAQGTLYTCSATNTWTSYYTPYTYPHPLVGGGSPAVSLSPSSYNFGNQQIGATSSSAPIQLTNSGTVTLNISNIGITGDFAILTNTCGATLAAGANCVVSPNFTPTGAGAKTGTLTFTTDASTSPDVLNLSGTGVAFKWTSGVTMEGVRTQ